MKLAANRLRDVVGSAELLADCLHQALELRRTLLLLSGIVDIRLLKIALSGRRMLVHLVVNLLLALRVVQFGPFLALQEEKVYLDVVIGQSLLASQSGDTRNDS